MLCATNDAHIKMHWIKQNFFNTYSLCNNFDRFTYLFAFVINLWKHKKNFTDTLHMYTQTLYISVYIYQYMHLYLSVYLSVHLSICLSIIYLSVYLPTYLPSHLSTCVCMCVYLYVWVRDEKRERGGEGVFLNIISSKLMILQSCCLLFLFYHF